MTTPPRIKSPCPMQWAEMQGNDRMRFCDHCQLHVENLSAMSARDAARVVERSASEHVCVTYTRRADGSLVTRAALWRERLFRPFRPIVSWAVAAFFPVALGACSSTPQTQMMGRPMPTSQAQGKTPPVAPPDESVVVGGI